MTVLVFSQRKSRVIVYIDQFKPTKCYRQFWRIKDKGARVDFSEFSAWPSLPCVFIYFQIAYKEAVIGLRPTLVTSFKHNYFCKDPIFKCSCILNSKGSLNGGVQFSPLHRASTPR